MSDLPETELTLSPHFKTARRFFDFSTPRTAWTHFSRTACDEVPPQRSSHVFVFKDDCIVERTAPQRSRRCRIA